MRDALRDYPELIPYTVRHSGLLGTTIERWLRNGATSLSNFEALAVMVWCYRAMQQPFPPPLPMPSEESEQVNELPELTWIRETLAPLVTRWQADAEAMSDALPPNFPAEWLAARSPALGGRRPLEFLDTDERRQTVASLLLSLETGTYW